MKGYDYSQSGAYFVTICTNGRVCRFGEVTEREMHLNEAGDIADQCWLSIPEHYPHVELDAYVVMPNHVHGIILITDSVEANVGENVYTPQPGQREPPKRSAFRSPSRTIGSVVRGFKIGVTKWFRQYTAVYEVWQRNYYEHIIRDEESLNQIRHYILNNPANWKIDKDNTDLFDADEWGNVGANNYSPLPGDAD